MKVVITGVAGLVGWHTWARLHAENCAAQFNNDQEPYEIVGLDHAQFEDDRTLLSALKGADSVLHFAGVNRAPDSEIEGANAAISERLAHACKNLGIGPHIIYANSTHALNETPYGKSKRVSGKILEDIGGPFTDLMLPHIFGEGARPFYNNVTATFISQIIDNEAPNINPDGSVQLLHASAAAQIGIDAAVKGTTGLIRPSSHVISVLELFEHIEKFHSDYLNNIFPDLKSSFIRDLFNCYRFASYPLSWPRKLHQNEDSRGTLFEAVKGGGGGQSFVSVTKPGILRGDHFHLHKVERFLVLKGEAVIRLRRVMSGAVWEYHVSGERPEVVDMPTLTTHSIENVGDTDLVTLFWTHDLFDPADPDTYADQVVQEAN